MNDEIMQELWRVKEALAAESGFDIRRLAAEIRKMEIQTTALGWRHIDAPLIPPTAVSALQRIRFFSK